MAFIMTLRIGNDAVLKSYSQWQLKEFRKLNNSGHELFVFKILLIYAPDLSIRGHIKAHHHVFVYSEEKKAYDYLK